MSGMPPNPPGLREAVRFALYRKQMKVLLSQATEILYGGAAGGGKSYLMRVAAIMICLEVDDAIVYIFRRLFRELLANHVYGPTGFLRILKPLLDDGLVVYNKSEQFLFFTETNSRIFLAHCQHEDDVLSYLGADFHALLIDEASQFTEKMLRFLRSRVRLGALAVPPKWKDKLPKIIYGTNPRGPAHGYLKRGFVDISRSEDHIWRAPEDDGGMLRQFVPALYTDNLVQVQNDPGYRNRLRGMGDKDVVDAYEKGDWNIREDAIFGGILDKDIHYIDSFPIPSEWTIDRGYDHGSSAPASALWFAEANGEEVQLAKPHYLATNGRLIMPKQSIVVCSELYFATYDEKGLDLDPSDMAQRMVTHQETYALKRARPGPADSAIFEAQPGFVSVAAMMAVHGITFKPSDKTKGSRVRGVSKAKQMLRAARERKDEPWLVVMDSCTRLWGHLVNLPKDEENPDDVSTIAVDHDWDTLRYRLLKQARQVREAEVEGT